MSEPTPNPITRGRDSLPPGVYRGIWYRPDRPRIVGMAAWICVAIGYLGFLLKGSQLPSLFMKDMTWLNPNWKPMPFSREQFAIVVLILIAEMILSLVCIAGAMGALRMKHWGRRTLIWYALIGAVMTLGKAAWQVSMFDFMLDYQMSTTTQPVDRASLENIQFLNLIIMTIVMLAWSGILLVLMKNRFIVESFDLADPRARHAASDDWQSTRTP